MLSSQQPISHIQNNSYSQFQITQPAHHSLLSPSNQLSQQPVGGKALKIKKGQKIEQLAQQQKQNSLSRSRKNSLQPSGSSQSQSRQKALKDTMTNFVQNTKQGGSFVGGSHPLNFSSSKGGKALRDISSQRNSIAHDSSHTPPRANSKKPLKKKKESRNQPNVQSIHNKPPLLTLQSGKRPETVKHQNLSQTQPVVNINLNTAVTSLRDSYPNPQIQASLNYYQPNSQQMQQQPHSQHIGHQHQHQLFSPVQLPQQIVSELESVATPHKSCQTCSKINNYMNNMNQKRGSIDDYSPSDNQHLISINQQDEGHHHHQHHHGFFKNPSSIDEYGQPRMGVEDLTNEKLQYQTLTNSSDTNAFAGAAQKNRTYTPKRQLNMNIIATANSNEKQDHQDGLTTGYVPRRDSKSKSHRKKEPKRIKSKGRKTVPALIIDEADSPTSGHPYFTNQQPASQQMQVSSNNPLRMPSNFYTASNSINPNTSSSQGNQAQPKLISLKKLKQILKSSQEGIGASCNEGKQELVQFKDILENEIQEYFKQSLNKLMFFKKEIKNDILKFHEDQKKEASQYFKYQQQLQENQSQSQASKRDDELTLQVHNLQRKCETLLKEVDLLNQKAEHSSKQIDQLRNKEFYQQTNENTLLDKLHALEQQVRNAKQQSQTQIQQLDDKYGLQLQNQVDAIKNLVKDSQKQSAQKLQDLLKEEIAQQQSSINEQLKQVTTQYNKKNELLKKENHEALQRFAKDFKDELTQNVKEIQTHELEISSLKLKIEKIAQDQSQIQPNKNAINAVQVEDIASKIVNAKGQAIKESLINYLEEKVAQLQQWVSPNQLDEKLDQLALQLDQENQQQRQLVTNSLNQQAAEINKIAKIMQEQESHQDLMFNTLQKRFQLQIEEELNSRDDQLRELFENEKQEFIQPIQENMQILDNMLKEYTQAKQQQILQQSQTQSQQNYQPAGVHSRNHSGRLSDIQQPNNEARAQLIEGAQYPKHHTSQQNYGGSSNQIMNSSQSNNDSYNKFLQQQFQDSNGEPDENSILRSSVSGTNLHMNIDDTPNNQGQMPFQDLLDNEEAKRYTQSLSGSHPHGRSRQQNIMVQDFMKSSESLQAASKEVQDRQPPQDQLRQTVKSANVEQFKREANVEMQREGIEGLDFGDNPVRAESQINRPSDIQTNLHGRGQSKEYARNSHKANSVDFNNRNDNQFEEVKVEDLEIYSPFHVKGKSESVHSASGSYSEGNRFDSINVGHHGSAQNRVKRQKSGKTSHQSIEKTNSDFFNLTQESNLELMNQLMNSNFNNMGVPGSKSGANSSLNQYNSPISGQQNPFPFKSIVSKPSKDEFQEQAPSAHPFEEVKVPIYSDPQRSTNQQDNRQPKAISQNVEEEEKKQNETQPRLDKRVLEKRFGKLSNEITEDVFINELVAAFDECFGYFENRVQLNQQSQMPQMSSPDQHHRRENAPIRNQDQQLQQQQPVFGQPNNNLYLYERIEPSTVMNSGQQQQQQQDIFGMQPQSKQPQQMMRRQGRQAIRTGASNPMLNIDIEDQKQEQERDRHFLDKRRVSPNPSLRQGDKVELENNSNRLSRNQLNHSQGGSLTGRVDAEMGSQDNRSQVQVKDFEEDDAIDVALASHDYSDRYELSISNNGD